MRELVFMAVMAYLERFLVGIAEPEIKEFIRIAIKEWLVEKF